jgi:hypothetical protein
MQKMPEDVLEECKSSLENMYALYSQHPYMLQRFHYHMTTYLPSTLANELKGYDKRVDRTNTLTNEQQIFIQVFLSKNAYYYLPNNGCFYEYDGKHYKPVKEDDIQHKLLTTISSDKTIMPWKHKTKINIIKQIKERNILKSVPETDTIQNILGILSPSIFTSKNQAKYFLTIIGDNIFKKNSDLIFLVDIKTRRLLTEIDNIAYMMIGQANTTHNFMTKYHESHDYNNCRLLKTNEVYSMDLWKDLLQKIGLDLLCVAAHYSARYENSENYIMNKADSVLKTYALFLKNNTQQQIVDKFIAHSIQKVNVEFDADFSFQQTQTQPQQQSIYGTSPQLSSSPLESGVNFLMKKAFNYAISWKNMHYLWKQYLSAFSLPNVIYSNTLKAIFKERLQYQDFGDTFINVTSKYLPLVSEFLSFWDETINMSEGVSGESNESYFDNELEVDEICMLFKSWHSNNSITETDVLKLLKHFFSSLEIVEDKYVLNVSCSLWDKVQDIDQALQQYKTHLKQMMGDIPVNEHNIVSFDSAYNFYTTYCSSLSSNVVSKRYFEKYLYSMLHNFIVFERFICVDWYMN